VVHPFGGDCFEAITRLEIVNASPITSFVLMPGEREKVGRELSLRGGLPFLIKTRQTRPPAERLCDRYVEGIIPLREDNRGEPSRR
jgi:hypothetical protein